MEIVGKNIILRDKKLADAWNDYTWRRDSELARFDAAPLLNVSFAQFLLDYTSELCFPERVRRHFAIESLDKKHIGNCGIYAIDESRGEAELGIMIGNRDYWDKGYGTEAVTAALGYGFRQTRLTRIYLKTLEWNTRAHRCFLKSGFIPCGRLVRDGYNFLLMDIHRWQWEKRQKETRAELTNF